MVVGAERLTRFDLSDEENVRQAEFELRRCATDFDYARWARLWGEAALDRCARNTSITRRRSNTKRLRS